jgi:hypothetical protein
MTVLSSLIILKTCIYLAHEFTSVFNGVRVTPSLDLYVMFCRSLFCFYFFFWPLCSLSFVGYGFCLHFWYCLTLHEVCMFLFCHTYQMLGFRLTIYVLYLMDVFLNEQSAYTCVPIVLFFLPTCFFSRMIQTSCRVRQYQKCKQKP